MERGGQCFLFWFRIGVRALLGPPRAPSPRCSSGPFLCCLAPAPGVSLADRSSSWERTAMTLTQGAPRTPAWVPGRDTVRFAGAPRELQGFACGRTAGQAPRADPCCGASSLPPSTTICGGPQLMCCLPREPPASTPDSDHIGHFDFPSGLHFEILSCIRMDSVPS